MSLVAGSRRQPSTPGRGRRPTRVLVVERDPARRVALTRWLEALPGVTVVAVSSACEAMGCERPQSFALCLLRHELTGVDGLTLGAMIRSLNAETRLVLMRSECCPLTARLALEHGFTAVVDDPVVGEQLELLIAG